MADAAVHPHSGTVLYQERLYPAFWIWIVVLGAAGAGVLTFAPIGLVPAIIAPIVITAILAILLVLSTPKIIVTPRTLQVGRAQIEREYIGEVRAFTGDAATEQRGTRLSGIAYLCLRGWISPVVWIEITDEADRTPYWLTSTRHPQELCAVLTERSLPS